MAQFTTQGRLKLQVFNRDGVQCKLVGNGFVGGLRSFQGRFKEKLVKFVGSSGTTRLYASLSEKSFNNFSTEATRSTSDEQEGVDGGESHEDDESVYESDELSCFRGLVLDIAYRVNCHEQRSLCGLDFYYYQGIDCWDAPCGNLWASQCRLLEACYMFGIHGEAHVFVLQADVLEYYDQTVNSPNGSFYIPAVLRVPHLLQVVKRRRIKNTLSRKNILHRDNYSCQYCSSHENLTIDHVVPASRGGDWRWENLVAACVKCNSKKGQKTLEEANMKLLKVPKAPKEYDILAIPLTNAALRMLKMRKGTPEEWHPYLAP